MSRQSLDGDERGAVPVWFGYNVQVTVDTEHHLIVTHEVTNSGSDRAQLSNIASQVKDILGVDKLEAIADRGYFSGEQILACDQSGISVTLPKPMTSGVEARGRFNFVYLGDEDVIVARLERNSNTTTQTRKRDRSCGATGPMRVAMRAQASLHDRRVASYRTQGA